MLKLNVTYFTIYFTNIINDLFFKFWGFGFQNEFILTVLQCEYVFWTYVNIKNCLGALRNTFVLLFSKGAKYLKMYLFLI